MVEKYLAKICINKDCDNFDKIGRKIADYYKELGNTVYLQIIDNITHGKWLTNQKVMYWGIIIDVYYNAEGYDEFVDAFMKNWKAVSNDNPSAAEFCDVYLASEMIYREPLERAEIITSCYEWNYSTEESLRDKVMKEHFLMEQRQKYYDYVSFQMVKQKLEDRSKRFDFFFESHVSAADGIDKIYGEEVLEEMRTHSRMFLNTDTRHLSFGVVTKY